MHWVYDDAGSVATRAEAADGAAEAAPAGAGAEESVEDFMIREFYPWVKTADDCQRCLEFLRSKEKMQFDVEKARVVMKQLRVRKHEGRGAPCSSLNTYFPVLRALYSTLPRVSGATAFSWPCWSGPWTAIARQGNSTHPRCADPRPPYSPPRYAGKPLRALPRTPSVRAPEDVAGCACSLPWRPCAHTMRLPPPPTSSHAVGARQGCWGSESQRDGGRGWSRVDRHAAGAAALLQAA